MALTKSAQTPHAASAQAAGGSTTGGGGWLPINYGVTGVAKVVNTATPGGTATTPTVGSDMFIELAQDGTGTGAEEVQRQTAGVASGVAYRMPFSFGVGGNLGDFSHYRVSFGGNTGSAVSVSATAMTTTAL